MKFDTSKLRRPRRGRIFIELEISGFEWELGFHKHVEKEEIISRRLNSPPLNSIDSRSGRIEPK